MKQCDVDRLKAACGRVTISGKPEGTAFLIDPQQVVTAWHVVRTLEAEPKSLQFECTEGPRKLVRIVNADPGLDAAILSLESPLAAAPLELSSTGEPTSGEWTSFGFPQFTRFHGHICAGSVRDAKAVDDRGVASLQLYTEDLAAGLGQPLHGLSGAPIVCGGQVVGHVRKGVSDRRFLPTAPSAQGRMPEYSAAAAVIYACPVFIVRRLLGQEAVTAEHRVRERVARDLTTIREALARCGNDLSRIDDYARRCVRWRYVPGLLEVRLHQVKVTRDKSYEAYARAQEQLGVAYYLAGDAEKAERAWKGADAVYRKVGDARLIEDFREAVRETRLRPPGWLLQP